MSEDSNVTVEKKNFKMPHVFIILMVIAAICALASYVFPAGQYEMIEFQGRMIANPESFSYIDRTPVGFLQFFVAFPEGMRQAADIIFCIFMVGGAVFVIEATGAIEAGLGRVAKRFAGKEIVIIPIMMVVFSSAGATYGMAEETIAFVPIMITLAMSLGYDSITGVAMVMCGAAAGFTTALTNPFTVGVAQAISELPMFSGIEFRAVMYVCMVTLTTAYVMRYARKVKKNPQLSLMYEIDQTRDTKLDLSSMKELTPRRAFALWTLILGIVVMVYGVMVLEWYIQEISALFIIVGLVGGIGGGMQPSEFATKFGEGCANLAGGALVVGFSRAILVILTSGNLLHSLLHWAAGGISRFPAAVSVQFMYLFQAALNYLIPSGSGQAAVSMPIMAPLSDLVGITRQTAVIAFQLADGIANVFMPTSGYFMAALALAKIPYENWVKWILPLIGLQYLLGAIFVAIAQAIELGPF